MTLITRGMPEDWLGQVALRDSRTSMTWREADTHLNRAVSALRQIDVPAGARAAIFAENAVEVILGHVAGLLAGKSTVPINHHLRPEEIALLLKASNAGILLVGPETSDRGVAAARQAGVPHVFGWRCPGREGIGSWDALLARQDPRDTAPSTAPRPPLLFSSGTTGIPKAIELPSSMFPGTATMEEHVAEIKRTDALAPLGAHLVVGPLYHTGPFGACRLFAAGVPVVVVERFDPEDVLKAIAQFGIATVVMVPTHFRRLLALPSETRRKYDMSSLAFVGHTGAPCPQDVKREMIAWWGNVIWESYGATEIGGVARISAQDWLKHPGSVGRARDRFEFLIVDENGDALPPRAEGRIFFIDKTGQGICYKDDPEKTAAAHLRPGVFTLGEIGYVDEEGFLYITDRFADVVLSGGVNLYPAEAEHILLKHPDVEDVACIGIPDRDLGEILHALVIPTRPDANPAGLIGFCRDHLTAMKCPRSVEFVDTLNRNAMGKINKRSLREPFWREAGNT